MEEQELNDLGAEFKDLVQKIALYVKNQTKTGIESAGTCDCGIRKSQANSELGSIEAASYLVDQKTVFEPCKDQHKNTLPESFSADRDSTNVQMNRKTSEDSIANRNGVRQQQFGASARWECKANKTQENNGYLPMNSQVETEIGSISSNHSVQPQMDGQSFLNEDAMVKQTISEHLWLIEDLLQYPHNDCTSLVHQFVAYIDSCLRIHPVLITVLTEDPRRPTALLFANRTDKLKALADIIRVNADWLKHWLCDRFFAEPIGHWSMDGEGKTKTNITSNTHTMSYEHFAADLQHSTLNPESELPKDDSGYSVTDKYDSCNSVIDELLKIVDKIRRRALDHKYDIDYDEILRKNVTKILNRTCTVVPSVAYNGAVPLPIGMKLLDSNKKLACRLVHAENQLNNLQMLMTHFNQSLCTALSNNPANTINSTTITEVSTNKLNNTLSVATNPTDLPDNRWFSPF